MANNVTAQFPEIWDDKIQQTFYNNNVARNIVEMVP